MKLHDPSPFALPFKVQVPFALPEPAEPTAPAPAPEPAPAVLIAPHHTAKPRRIIPPVEYKVVAMRECPLPADMALCDNADSAAQYWNLCIASNPYFNGSVENFAVLLLNCRRRVTGFQIVSQGTQDTILVHPREVFRLAIHQNAAAIIIMHNHPSGESTPSEADIKVTRDLIRAGQLLKIEVCDHVVVGRGQRASLKELGYFYS